MTRLNLEALFLFRYNSFTGTYVVDTSKGFYYKWLALVSCTIIYNLVMIIARSVFWKLNNSLFWLWFMIDYLCDLIYVMDMVVNARTGLILVLYF